MEYTTLAVEGNEVQGWSQEQTHSLYAMCKQIGDKRAARGKRHPSGHQYVRLGEAGLAHDGMQAGAPVSLRC
jgi:hypothetical protein